MNLTWSSMIREEKKNNNNTAKQYCKLATIIGKDMSFQPAFEGNKTFAFSIVYRKSIEYFGTRVCNRLHSLI